jgi:hypothetical protein
MLLLDVEKACDYMWHDALLHKFLEYRFSMVYTKLIWSFLTDRKFYVTVAGERSAECEVPSGVPQGAVLSPTLFNIFTSDFTTLTDVQLARGGLGSKGLCDIPYKKFEKAPKIAPFLSL